MSIIQAPNKPLVIEGKTIEFIQDGYACITTWSKNAIYRMINSGRWEYKKILRDGIEVPVLRTKLEQTA